MIYHLTEPRRWERSLAEGVHTGSTRGVELATEGFIHCSTADQWPLVRARFYADVAELLLLHVDESRLDAPLVYEQVGDADQPFPHVYGAIPLDAVVAVERLDRREGDVTANFTTDSLRIDEEAEIAEIAAGIDHLVHAVLRRRGAVVAVSGGIDSAACAALCVRALGAEHVQLLALPEADSSPESLALARQLADALGADLLVEDITQALAGAGCYERQMEAIRSAVPEFGPGWRHKLTLPSLLEHDRLNITRLTVEDPFGEQRTLRLPTGAYLQIVAATNFKQRMRTTFTYYHADRLNAAVCGTPNRLEYDQGFFVKGGDGLADFKPIAHLYKSQVYAVAAALGVPEEILQRAPTTDTFSLPQGQDEFYFSLPYHLMDLCLLGHNEHAPLEEVAAATGLTVEQVARVDDDIESKRRATAPLHRHGMLIRPVPEIA